MKQEIRAAAQTGVIGSSTGNKQETKTIAQEIDTNPWPKGSSSPDKTRHTMRSFRLYTKPPSNSSDLCNMHNYVGGGRWECPPLACRNDITE